MRRRRGRRNLTLQCTDSSTTTTTFLNLACALRPPLHPGPSRRRPPSLISLFVCASCGHVPKASTLSQALFTRSRLWQSFETISKGPPFQPCWISPFVIACSTNCSWRQPRESHYFASQHPGSASRVYYISAPRCISHTQDIHCFFSESCLLQLCHTFRTAFTTT